MDIGDLSEKTYQAIMMEAERFHHDLTLEFGLLSDECDDEKVFIEKSKMLIGEMLKYDAIDRGDIFFGNPPKKKEFHTP